PDGNRQVDIRQRDEAAEALADPGYLQQRRVVHRRTRVNQPRIPLGAATTKPSSISPTISSDSAEEIVTVASCCNVPSNTAPITGPSQLAVPPISGMAMVFTA